MEDLQNQIEAILFLYGDFISVEEIQKSLNFKDKKKIEICLKKIQEKINDKFTFEIFKNESNEWKMGLKKNYENIAENLISKIEIPQHILKILSIIAYEEPITNTRLKDLVGKYSKNEVDYLYKLGFITYTKKGIGKYYKTTKKFFEYFDIEENFREKANQKIKQKILEFEK